jgi:predicted  nucleic acid-binding Zn-ribbon protein
MDQELKAYLDEKFGEVDAKFVEVKTEIRHNGVQIEGLHGQIKLLAEGLISFNQRFTSLENHVSRELADHRQTVTSAFGFVNDRIQALEEWKETKERDPIEIIKERFGLG